MAEASPREAVALFHDAGAFEAGVEDLLMAGFDRSLVSVLATTKTIEQKLGHIYEDVETAADDLTAPRIAFVGQRSRTLLRDAAAAELGYVGAAAAAGAVVASNGALEFAIAAALVAGIAGAAVGLMLGRLLESRHARHLQEQLEHGGILVWVRTFTSERERAASDILSRRGGTGVHVHEIPSAEPLREGGVSQDLAWINKPVFVVRPPVHPGARL